MTLGIMQPYFFPYIGYFQLMHAVDRFIIMDDVTFQKKGWIQRNKMLLYNKKHLFTVPLKHASSFTLLTQLDVNKTLFPQWEKKFLLSLEHAYKKAPYFNDLMPVIHEVLNSDFTTIAELATNSVCSMRSYLGIGTTIIPSSTIYNNIHLYNQARIIDMCVQERCTGYINLSGGTVLYSKEAFAEKGVQLNFMMSDPIYYKHDNDDFIPWLSIIDVAMYNSKDTIKGFLESYFLF